MISRLTRLITYLARPSFLGDNVFIDATHSAPGFRQSGIDICTCTCTCNSPSQTLFSCGGKGPGNGKTIVGFYSQYILGSRCLDPRPGSHDSRTASPPASRPQMMLQTCPNTLL